MNNTRELNTMCRALQELKEKENEARDARLHMEERILAMLPKMEPESTNKYPLEDYNLTVTRKVYRKVDSSAYEELEMELPEAARDAVITKYSISTPTYRKLLESGSDAAGMLNQCITTTDAKPALSIKEINE